VNDAHVELADVDLPAAVVDGSAPGLPVLWINPAFIRLTGYTWPEVIGTPAAELAGLSSANQQLVPYAEAVAERRTISDTIRAYHKAGMAYWCEVTLAPIGTSTRWLVVARDVSVRVNTHLAGSASKEREHRARAGLSTLAELSDQLADVDNRHVLLDVALTLQRATGRWAGFFILDKDLGVDGVTLPVPNPLPPGDEVAELIAGHHRGNAILDPANLDPQCQPVSTTLIELARQAGAPDGPLAVRGVPGRDEILAVLVATPRETVEQPELFIDVVDLVVRRVGAALETSRLVARERHLAEALQQALLPAQEDIACLDVWTYYAPSSEHAQVGGDWYDVGRVDPDRVFAIVGDATGHDVNATAAMGQLRSIVRAYVLDPIPPGEILERTDHLASAMAIRRTASAIVAELIQLDAPTPRKAWALRYSRAGHMPPLVLRDGAVLVLADGSGPLLGYGTGARATGQTDLAPGDALILYTDGLVERRNRTLRQGLEELVTSAASCVGTAADIGEELLVRLADAPEDDIAVVVIRIPAVGESLEPGRARPRSRRWALPSEPASIARARHAAARVCHEWAIPRADDVELVITELVANAVLHGGGHLRLRMFDLPDVLRIEVEDANPTPPVLVHGHPGRTGGIGLQLVERLGNWGWAPAGDGKLVWATITHRGDNHDA
jgi:PAS domain S-box-containing protein